MDDPPIKKWYVVFPVDNAAELLIAELPEEMAPGQVVHAREGEKEDANRLIHVTVKAYTEREASQTAREAMARACAAVGWTKIPEIRRISEA
jgi:hypothetical protein